MNKKSKEKLNLKMFILCGGRGKRLGSITSKIPKPLVKIGSKPMLHHKLDFYTNQGISDFIFCTGYKSDQIMQSISNYKNISTKYSNQGEKAGILKRIYEAQKLSPGTNLVSYGDTITDIDLKLLAKTHLDSGLPCTIVTAPIIHPFGLINSDKEGYVTSFSEKPILKYFIGYSIISDDFFDFIPKEYIEMEDGTGLICAFKYLIERKLLKSYFHEGKQITFNTPEEHRSAEESINGFLTLK